jgi:hypothetical protein
LNFEVIPRFFKNLCPFIYVHKPINVAFTKWTK